MGRTPHGLPRRVDPHRLTDTAGWLDGTWEEGIARVASGIPDRLARLKALGNAVVPQVAEHVGRLIVEAEAGQ